MRAIVPLTAMVAALTLVPSIHARPSLSPLVPDTQPVVREALPEALQASTVFPRVYLHGGPGSLEGRFEDAQGGPDWQGWTPVDLTDVPAVAYWQRSTFNAANLGANGLGNHAMWCGRTAEQEPGWVAAPGYGNGWDAPLQWSSGPLSDPSVGRIVTLDFFLNHDSEDGYDFTHVRYRKSGQWVTVWSVDGRNSVGGVFEPPGVQFSTVGAAPIVYDGNDYAGPNLDEIVVQIWFASDGGFSDEDGLFPSVAGAAQVDDVLVRYLEGGVQQESFEDFEGPGPYAWESAPPAVVGDFAKVLVGLTDIDPCRENPSPQATFIDDGTPPSNLPGQSTGGSTSPYGTYGTPDGWVINLTGGIAGGTERLRNEIWSPAIALDAPGPADDGPGWRPYLQFSVFYHAIGFMPGHAVKMRQSADGVVWGAWTDITGVYFFASGRFGYYDERLDLEDHLLSGSNFIQIALGPVDPADFGLGNPDFDDAATPAPWFDDVMVYKDRTGTLVSTETRGRPIDAFPASGSVDVSTPAARDPLDVPIDAYWFQNFTDHPRVQIDPVGSSGPPTDLRMVWILEKNPLFEDALRVMPPGTTVIGGASPLGGDRWQGSFPSQATGAPTEFEFVAPDQDFVYPGDVLRWYVQVTSAEGIVTTDPQDLAGFDTGVGWNEDYTVRALPSLRTTGGEAPSILVVDYDDSRPGDDPRLLQAFAQNGLTVGIDFDYLRARPRSPASFLGAQASDAQMELYSTLFVLDPIAADETVFADLARLDTWNASPGDRHAVWIGRSLVSRLTAAPATDFVSGRLGVELLGTDGLSAVGGRRYPGLVPQMAPFASAPILDLTCYGRAFDRLRPLPGAVVGHGITTEPPDGPVIDDLAGSIVHDRTIAEGRRVDVTLPVDLERLMTPRSKVDGRPATATLVGELLALVGQPGSPTPAPAPRRAGIFGLATEPNPFNPATTVRFTLGTGGAVRVRIVNLRGAVVRTLHDGWMEAGERRLRWDGRGDDGRSVASGVYLADVRGNGQHVTVKMALMK